MADETADLRERVAEAQRRVYQSMDAGRWPDWARLDLSMAQLKVLLRLSGERRPHLGDVASGLGVGLSTASHLVDRLVRHGLVQRCEDPEDRRRLLLTRTAEGEELVDRLRRAGRQRLFAWLDRLTPEELRALVRGMEALARAAAEEADRPGPGSGCE